MDDPEASPLSRSYELHFNERPYLHHTSYLYITKTTRERSRQQSNFSILCRGNIIPREVKNPDAVSGFLECVDQFVQIINDSRTCNPRTSFPRKISSARTNHPACWSDTSAFRNGIPPPCRICS
ncbi:MAG: hypothetical protein ACLR8Y_10510 [Alistipes indistinctus]